jgi:basic membrane protein A
MTPRLTVVLAFVLLLAPSCKLNSSDESLRGLAPTPGIDFRVCQIVDPQGLTDHSYNQAIARGLAKARLYLGAESNYRDMVKPADLTKDVESFILRGCDLIVIPTSAGDVSQEVAANPDQRFALVDVDGSAWDDPHSLPQAGNVTTIGFRSDEGSYLTGYLSAGASRSGAIATIGGQRDALAVALMESYAAGARAYNSKHGTHVRIAGAPSSKDPGTFTGSDSNFAAMLSAAATAFRDGADIVYPIGVPAAGGAVPAAKAAGGALVWQGTNGCRSIPESCGLFLTSVVNNVDTAVFNVIKRAVADRFRSGTYLADLADEGVTISPFHFLKSRVSPSLRKELVQLRDAIIAGDRTVGTGPPSGG